MTQVMSPTFSSSRTIGTPLSRLSATATPTVGCPANASSLRGVKMRTEAVWVSVFGDCTKTVSERFSSRAIRCIWSSSSPSAWRTTASGLPLSRSRVNTSSNV